MSQENEEAELHEEQKGQLEELTTTLQDMFVGLNKPSSKPKPDDDDEDEDENGNPGGRRRGSDASAQDEMAGLLGGSSELVSVEDLKIFLDVSERKE